MNLLKYCCFLSLLTLILFSCGRPIAKFTYPEQKITAPVEVAFENESKKAETYEWDFGDGNTSTDVSPKHQYTTAGKYIVKLTAKKGDKTTTMEKKININVPDKCLVILETEFGNMTIELFDATPQHRDNFIKLIEDEYLEGLLFHRVINGFMIQGGDPDSRDAKPGQPLGMGGPGYTVPAEFTETLFHGKGALSAARQPDQVNPTKASSGSQFYIVHGRPVNERELDVIEAQKDFRYSKEQREKYMTVGGTPQLDKDYTVFGQVISGLEIIDEIAKVATDGRDRPKEDVKMSFKVVDQIQ